MQNTETGFLNCHTHIFDGVKDVPNGFLPLGLKRIVSTKVGFWLVGGIMKLLNSESEFFGMSKGALDRYVQFVQIGKLGSQRVIFENMLAQYPADTKFIILPMDMAFEGCGDVPRPYPEQLKELRDLVKIYPNNLIPFCAIDCRRPDCFDLFKQAIEEWGFKGLKLYPPIGTFPYDQRYYPIYDYCQSNNLPVISHCTDGNPVFFKGSQNDLIELLQGYRDCGAGAIDWSIPRTNKQLCAFFTHPLGYKKVMDDFPDLKICLAHYGYGNQEENDVGGMDWDDIVKDMMLKYPNLYADCAYSMVYQNNWASLKVQLSANQQLREHFLFGSDFYMVEVDGTEKQFCINFRAYLGEELWQQIAVLNPKKFLGIKC